MRLVSISSVADVVHGSCLDDADTGNRVHTAKYFTTYVLDAAFPLLKGYKRFQA